MSRFSAEYCAEKLLCGGEKYRPGELAARALNAPRTQIAALEELYAARGENGSDKRLAGALLELECTHICAIEDLGAEDARGAVDDIIAFRVYARYFVNRYHPHGKHCAEALGKFRHDLPNITAQLRRESNIRRTTLPGSLRHETEFAVSGGAVRRREYFASLGGLLMYDMLLSLSLDFGIRLCPSCNRCFVPPKGNVVYCDGAAPHGDGKTCRELGASRQHAQRVAEDEAARLCKKACGRIYTRKSRGRISAQQADDMLARCAGLLELTRLGELDISALESELAVVTDSGKEVEANG